MPAIEFYAMKNLKRLWNNWREGFPKKERKRREKPLPYDWHHVVWQGNHVIMNHYPVWGYPVSKIMEDRLHKVILKKVVELERLPTLEELKNTLRTDGIKTVIAETFKEKAHREMHDVDYEIGIHMACNFMGDPRPYDASELVKRIKRGSESAGTIIQAFYSNDYR
jgi:hypothetical protein